MDDGFMIVPVESDVEPFSVSLQYVEKHSPVVGGYFIEYNDGYQSFSPTEPFESGYERIYTNEAQPTTPAPDKKSGETVN